MRSNKLDEKVFWTTRKGISLITIAISIIIIVIILLAIIMNLKNANIINDTNFVALKSDIVSMVDKYRIVYQKALYNASGDFSKIDETEFMDIVPKKYSNDFFATKSGIIYKGTDKDVIDISRKIGIIIIINEPDSYGIDSIDILTDSNSLKLDVNLTNYNENIEEYTFYVSEDMGKSWNIEKSTYNGFVLENLKSNTRYTLKVEAKTSSGNKLDSKLYEVSTNNESN